jgi:hypothetical protein
MSNTNTPAEEQQTTLNDVTTTSAEVNLFRSFAVDYVYSDKTLPLDQSFCKIDDHTYAQLETQEGRFDTYGNSIRVVSQGMIDRISLDSFPVGQYTLSINGQNCSTARYNTARKCFEFDFSGKRSSLLDAMITVSQNVKDLPQFPNLEKYLNCERVDKLIIFPSVELPEGEYTISLHGYFPSNIHPPKFAGPYVEKTMIKKVYPHSTYNLSLNHPTDCLDIFLGLSPETTDCTVIMELDGYEALRYDYHELNDHTQCCVNKQRWGFEGLRIKFNNPDLYYMGAQNLQLPEEINKHTINLSRVSTISIITINCRLVKCVQSYFMTYRYPSRTAMYCN